jgi:hypothetical protein
MVDSLLVDLVKALLTLLLELVKLGNHVFEVLVAVRTETGDLCNVTGGHVVDGLAFAAQAGDGAGGHGESHVFGPVDKFEDGGGCLVFLDGFDAEDAGVATGTVQEAFTEGAEEFGNERVGFL